MNPVPFEHEFMAALSGQSLTVIALAFAGGVACSLLPCTMGMLPILIGYMGAYSELSKGAILRQILLYICGLSLVLTLFGVGSSMLGIAFAAINHSTWYFAAGVLAIVMGLHLLNVLHLPLPQFITKLPETNTGHWLAPLLMGIAFGLASSPCGTPFLAGILTFMSTQKNYVLGGASLFAYGVGQSMLLLVIGLFTGLLKHMAILRRIGNTINMISGGVFILGGLLLMAEAFGWMPLLGQ